MYKTTSIILLWLLIISFSQAYAQPAGYSYGKEITIPQENVAGNLNEFPLLISLVDNDLRSTRRGGNVSSINGYDIIFTLSDASTVLQHQIEKFNEDTGEYVAWVQVPTLNGSSANRIFMYYGNSSVAASDPSTNLVWGNDYKRVLHLHDDFNDGTNNNSNGTNAGSADGTGKIADGQFFDGTDDYMTVANTTSESFTISAWVNPYSLGSNADFNAFGGSGIIWSDVSACADDMIPMALNNDRFSFGVGNAGCAYNTLQSSSVATVSNWYYVVVTRDASTGEMNMYMDGVNVGNINGVTGNLSGNGNIFLGSNPLDGRYFHGMLDEVRFLSTVRSEEWISTEYNNQSSPGSFYTIGSQVPASDLQGVLPVTFGEFGIKIEENAVSVSWTTLSELNNDYFEIERKSPNGEWETVGRVEGNFNSNQVIKYSWIDYQPLNNLAYYRIKQVDYDGAFEYGRALSINFRKEAAMEKLTVYPNPTQGVMHVRGMGAEKISIFSYRGESMQGMFELNFDGQSWTVDVSKLESGLYTLICDGEIVKFYKR